MTLLCLRLDDLGTLMRPQSLLYRFTADQKQDGLAAGTHLMLGKAVQRATGLLVDREGVALHPFNRIVQVSGTEPAMR